MCCIVGNIGTFNAELFEKSAKTMHRRGPNGFDFFFDAAAEIALGHGRLAIRDLSEAGLQPMASSCGRYVIVFNGEIYNTEELKAICPDTHWRGSSDTEVLLALISRVGFRAAIEKAVGMFAIGLWDRSQGSVFLARDRFGEKPLYYAHGIDGGLFFASELKAIISYLGPLDVDRNSIVDYLRHACVTGERSIYKIVKKLPSAHILEYKISRKELIINQYWSPPQFSNSEVSASEYSAQIDSIESTLVRAVEEQLVSDVPIGAFLSGGVDSSLVVSIASKALGRDIQTFTVGFQGGGEFSEIGAASKIASHLGVRNEVLEVCPNDMLDFIEDLPLTYCEPFADSSQLATMLVSTMAKKHVTVALSGDGGDEVFWGYNRYLFYQKYQKHFIQRPFVRHGIQKILNIYTATSGKFFDHLASRKVAGLSEKIEKIERVLKVNSASEYYAALTTFWPEVFGYEPSIKNRVRTFEDFNLEDIRWYLPDDVLTKVDRASMWSSLETRAPFLDHRVIEAASMLPVHAHVNSSGAKLITKKILGKYLPPELMSGPKKGFGVPIHEWLRKDLKAWAEDLIADDWFWSCNLIDKKHFEKKWADFLVEKNQAHHEIWSVLLLMQWARYWGFPKVS